MSLVRWRDFSKAHDSWVENKDIKRLDCAAPSVNRAVIRKLVLTLRGSWAGFPKCGDGMGSPPKMCSGVLLSDLEGATALNTVSRLQPCTIRPASYLLFQERASCRRDVTSRRLSRGFLKMLTISHVPLAPLRDHSQWEGPPPPPVRRPRPRSRSEGAIRATLTRTPSASSLLRARRAVFPS
ncbi:hypothetical protein PR048_033274 [Dryococelus australis]|uniref:Uncharacterized protein n=1 Tax=Dryococelus australis TaxID=614101 RepID=A0ABQ9G365_9NEOP|nr:hypothetical protein PR048_033274 [Dryococelus australis]